MKKYGITFVAALGLLVGCNKSVENASQKFNELPPAVQKTVRAQYPNGEVADVTKKTENGMDVYEVQFREPGVNPKLLVATDGKLITSDSARPAGAIQRALTPSGAVGTKFSALPEKAQMTIKAKAPETDITDISRQEKDGRVIYEVAFRDKSTMRVAEDGTLVQEVQR
jgi:uncharacterized membrane protein YkoI